MSNRHFLFVIAGRALLSKAAVEGDFADRDVDLPTLCAAIEGPYGRRIEITSDQWRFLRGVYAMNAEAPPGLPRGDNVLLARGDGDSDGLLFFVDGDNLSVPMHAPPALLTLIEQQR